MVSLIATTEGIAFSTIPDTSFTEETGVAAVWSELLLAVVSAGAGAWVSAGALWVLFAA